MSFGFLSQAGRQSERYGGRYLEFGLLGGVGLQKKDYSGEASLSVSSETPAQVSS